MILSLLRLPSIKNQPPLIIMSDSGDVLNFYDRLPKKFKTEERHYDNESKVQIKLPFHMCITGRTGSGKTNALRNIIHSMACFDRYMLWTKVTDESLYAELIEELRAAEKKTGEAILTVNEDVKSLPPVDSFKTDSDHNTLLIIDDMIGEKPKDLKHVEDYYTRGRKKNISCIFLSQSYFDIPIVIRKQTGYFVFTKIAGDRDLTTILKDFQLGVDDEQIVKLFHEATKGGFPNFFMIDQATNDPKIRFRRNFKPLQPPEPTEDLEEGEPKEKKGPGPPGKRPLPGQLDRERPIPPGGMSSGPPRPKKGSYNDLQGKLSDRNNQTKSDQAAAKREYDKQVKEQQKERLKIELADRKAEAMADARAAKAAEKAENARLKAIADAKKQREVRREQENKLKIASITAKRQADKSASARKQKEREEMIRDIKEAKTKHAKELAQQKLEDYNEALEDLQRVRRKKDQDERDTVDKEEAHEKRRRDKDDELERSEKEMIDAMILQRPRDITDWYHETYPNDPAWEHLNEQARSVVRGQYVMAHMPDVHMNQQDWGDVDFRMHGYDKDDSYGIGKGKRRRVVPGDGVGRKRGGGVKRRRTQLPKTLDRELHSLIAMVR